MELSSEMRAIIAQGYNTGGEPELARQLAIGQDLMTEYRLFRRNIWREWKKIVAELYAQKYFVDGYKYINIDMFVNNTHIDFGFNYDTRSNFLPKLIRAFAQGDALKIYISICYIDYAQDSRAISYKHNIGVAIEKIAKTLKYISIEAFYQNSSYA